VIYGNLLVVLITAPLGLRVIDELTFRDAFAVFYLGVVQIGVAYTLFTVAMAQGVRSLDAGIVGYIEPILNPIWVFLALGERPTKWAVIGGGIIVAAVVVHAMMEARRGRHVAALE
jgi:drug/metabolite transporter (DMT)-like permease